MIVYQASWSLIDYTMVLIFVWFIILAFTFLQVSTSIKELIESIEMREAIGKNTLWFVSSSTAYAFFLYLFVHRTYYLASFIGFVNLSIILCVLFTSVATLLLFSRKRCFRDIRHIHTKKKGFILSFLLLCFLIPLVSGVVFPIIRDPNILVSSSPREISYAKGDQVQEVENIKIEIKPVEGYAWNIKISVEAPPTFFIWVDGIENGTKRISFLAYDQAVAFPLEIQPSYTVRNGTYTIKISCSYESASGYLTQKSTMITVFIGKEKIPYFLPMYGAVIIMIVVVIIITAVYTFLKRKARYTIL